MALGASVGVASLSGCEAQDTPQKEEPEDHRPKSNGRSDIDSAPTALPSDITNLPEITATLWVTVSDDAADRMEGPIFDEKGALYVCHRHTPSDGRVKTSKVLKISADKQVDTFYELEGGDFNGLALHEDGRLFIADMSGHIRVVDEKGEALDELPCFCGEVAILPNDLVFGKNGDLYIANFAGNALNPAGGVYRLTAESKYQTMVVFQEGLHTPNGLCFSNDYQSLWVAETSTNRILKIGVAEDGSAKTGFLDVSVVYQGQGSAGPDSTRVDEKGNVYQAYYPGGRALVLNASGVPVANILVENREIGDALFTASIALRPNETKGYLLSCGARGANIMEFESLAAPTLRYFEV